MNEREISLVSEWSSFVSSENYNLIEKCLKLAQILEYPELCVSKEIDEIKEGITINIRSKITAWLNIEEKYSSNIERRESKVRSKNITNNLI